MNVGRAPGSLTDLGQHLFSLGVVAHRRPDEHQLTRVAPRSELEAADDPDGVLEPVVARHLQHDGELWIDSILLDHTGDLRTIELAVLHAERVDRRRTDELRNRE